MTSPTNSPSRPRRFGDAQDLTLIRDYWLAKQALRQPNLGAEDRARAEHRVEEIMSVVFTSLNMDAASPATTGK